MIAVPRAIPKPDGPGIQCQPALVFFLMTSRMISRMNPPTRNASSIDIMEKPPLPNSPLLRSAISSKFHAVRFRILIVRNFRTFVTHLSRILPVFLICALIAPIATAGEGIAREDGERLLVACNVAVDVINGREVTMQARVDAALCIGFVEGFLWGHGWKAWRTGEDMYFCPPEGFSYRQAVPIVVEYLEAHPERRIQRAHLLLFSALSSALPCKP